MTANGVDIIKDKSTVNTRDGVYFILQQYLNACYASDTSHFHRAHIPKWSWLGGGGVIIIRMIRYH